MRLKPLFLTKEEKKSSVSIGGLSKSIHGVLLTVSIKLLELKSTQITIANELALPRVGSSRAALCDDSSHQPHRRRIIQLAVAICLDVTEDSASVAHDGS